MIERFETNVGNRLNEPVNVLFVAYEFPPLNTAGVLRSLKFATYLPDFGIKPIVLTIKQEDGFTYGSYDKSLERELPAAVQVERIACPPPRKQSRHIHAWLQIMTTLADPHAKRWKPHVDLELPRLMEQYKPQAIYVSIPPFSMATLWCDYAQQYGIPLILDFRDAWSQWQATLFPTVLHYIATKRAEKRCLEEASVVICSSKQTQDDLQRVHSIVSTDKFSVITNGHETAFEVDYKIQTPTKASDHFVIGYVGSFYYLPDTRNAIMSPWWKRSPHRYLQFVSRKEDWLYRSPFFFFKAIRVMLDNNPALKDCLRIRFAGRQVDWLQQQAEHFMLSDIVEYLGFLSRQEVRDFEYECDALLVTSAKVIGGNDYSIASKTFEYLEARKPIIGFVTEGAQKTLLEKTGIALICDPDDTIASANRLSQLISGQVKFSPKVAYLNTLHRKQLTGELAKRIREAIGT